MRLSDVGAIIKDAATEWSGCRASSKGAALALYMIFSLAPMLILVIAVAGVFFGPDAVQAQLVDQLRDLMGERGAEVVQTVLASAHESNSGLLASLVSLGVLVFSATTAFAELQASLDELWQIPKDQQPGGFVGFLKARFWSFGLVVVLALFMLVSLTVSAALAAAHSIYGEWWSNSTFAATADIVARLFSFAVVTTLFAVVYKMLPSTRIPWRDVMPGALITAALFVLGKWGIGLYLGQGGIADTYGAAGSVVAVLLWIYYSAQIFFFGAVLTRQFAIRFGSSATKEIRSPY